MHECTEVINFSVNQLPTKKWEQRPDGKIVKTPEYAMYLFQMKSAFKDKYDAMMANPSTLE